MIEDKVRVLRRVVRALENADIDVRFYYDNQRHDERFWSCQISGEGLSISCCDEDTAYSCLKMALEKASEILGEDVLMDNLSGKSLEEATPIISFTGHTSTPRRI